MRLYCLFALLAVIAGGGVAPAFAAGISPQDRPPGVDSSPQGSSVPGWPRIDLGATGGADVSASQFDAVSLAGAISSPFDSRALLSVGYRIPLQIELKWQAVDSSMGYRSRRATLVPGSVVAIGLGMLGFVVVARRGQRQLWSLDSARGEAHWI